MVKYNFVNLLPFVQGTKKQQFFFKKNKLLAKGVLCALSL